jgi:hypothetical protein
VATVSDDLKRAREHFDAAYFGSPGSARDLSYALALRSLLDATERQERWLGALAAQVAEVEAKGRA